MYRSLEIKSVIKFWLIVISSLTPLIYLPVGGKLDSYYPKFIFLIIIFIILLASIIIFRKQSNQFIYFDKERQILSVFYILLIMSTLFAMDRTTALFGSQYRYEGLLTLSIYFLIFLISREIETIGKKFLIVMLGSGVIISIHGIMQAYRIDPIPDHYYFENIADSHVAFSSMGNPNHLGTYLVILIPFSLFLYIEKNLKLGFLFYIILFYALLCAYTRGSWIGYLCSFCIYYMLKIKQKGILETEKRKIKLIILTSVTLLLIYSFTSELNFVSRIFSIFSDIAKVAQGADDASTAGSYRIFFWSKSFELIKQMPIFGVGVDNLGVALKTFFESDIISNYGQSGFFTGSKAHNEYLHIAVTSGVPSLIVYLILAFLVIKKAVLRIKYSDLYLPISTSLIGFYSVGFFNNEVIMFAYLLWMILGLACSKNIIKYSGTEW